MRKVAQKDVFAINKIMLATIASFINCFANDSKQDVSMYVDDVVYNSAALQAFNNTQNAQALHSSIMQQDTLVREYFIDALKYIENNNLIAKHKFCCK